VSDQPTAVLAPPAPDQPAVIATRRTRPGWPGILSLGLAAVTVAGLVTGLVLVTADAYIAATWAAWIAAGASTLAVLVGVVALVGGFGRPWAIAGIVLGIVANPPVLTWALDAIGSLWA